MFSEGNDIGFATFPGTTYRAIGCVQICFFNVDGSLRDWQKELAGLVFLCATCSEPCLMNCIMMSMQVSKGFSYEEDPGNWLLAILGAVAKFQKHSERAFRGCSLKRATSNAWNASQISNRLSVCSSFITQTTIWWNIVLGQTCNAVHECWGQFQYWNIIHHALNVCLFFEDLQFVFSSLFAAAFRFHIECVR